MDYAVRDVLQKSERNVLNGGCHGIACVDRTDYDRPVPAAFSVDDSGRLVVGNNGEVLPYLACKAVCGEFLAQDGIGLAYGLKTVACDGSGTSDTESRTGGRQL